MSSIPHKRCVTCGAEKPLSDFHKCKSKPDGLFPTCKVCACARANAWRKRNPERDREIQKGTRARRNSKGVVYPRPTSGTRLCNMCQTEKHVSEFYADKGDPSGLRFQCAKCERRRSKEYRNRNIERVRENGRAWVERNKDKVAAMRANYRKKFRDKRRAYDEEYNRKYPEKRRERVMRRNARKKKTSIGPVDYRRIWERDRGFCYLCGQKVDPKDCWYDHVIPLAKGGAHIESNIAVTHSWCNQHKSARIVKYEQGELF